MRRPRCRPEAARPLRRGFPGDCGELKLVLQDVAVELGGCPIVAEADLVVEPGEFVGLVRPNGCGKSTLLHSIYRALRPAAGLISLDGDDLWRLPAKEAARRVVVVAQESPTDIDFTVQEVVVLDRTPHKRPLDRDTGEDRAICRNALERVSMASVHQRSYATLSGGESSASSSPTPSPSAATCTCSTSPPTTSTSATSWRFSAWSADSATRHWLRSTTSTWPPRTVTASTSWRRAGSSPAARTMRCSPPSALRSSSASAPTRWTHPLTGRPILAFDEFDAVPARFRQWRGAVS